MFRHLLGLAIVLLTCGISLSQEPWAILTGQSVMEVRSGLRHIYQRLGRKDLVAALDSAAITNLVSGNLKGLDLTRPLGAVILPNKSGAGCALTFIPATGEQAFLEFLRRHLLTVGTTEKGETFVEVPILGRAYIRFDKQYAWFAFSPDDLKDSLPDMAQLIPPSHSQAQLAATVYLERMPADQRKVWLNRAEQGLQLLAGNPRESQGQLMENLALPVAGLLFSRLAEDAREISFLAHADHRSDQLWAKIVVTPKPDKAWLAEVQRRAEQPVHSELPASLWAKVRGKSDEVAQRAAQKAFKNGQEENLILTVQGGNQLELKAEMCGSLLAYHAALNEPDDRPEKPRKSPRRERRRPSLR